MYIMLICVAVIAGAVMAEATTTAPPITCDSVPPPCYPGNLYCSMVGSNHECKACHESCNGCTSFGNSHCNACRAGFNRTDGVCLECAELTFGVNCTGNCHCQLGKLDCDPQTGHCKSFLCASGWIGAPYCQTRCPYNTFGIDCDFQCNCPPTDTCSNINGLCSSGKCGEEWSGAGCQNELPKLEFPPEVENVTCENVTVTWLKWRRSIDKGNSKGIIAQYELYSTYKNAGTNETGWKLEQTLQHLDLQPSYKVTLTSLVPDADYRFKVDVRQKNGDKLQKNILAGKPSDSVTIPCTVLTTLPTTTPIPGTTSRPSGQRFLDDSKFKVEFLDNQTSQIMVQWAIFANYSTLELNVTLEYYENQIWECQVHPEKNVTIIQVPTNGNFNITNLLPWRHYVISVTARVIDQNHTDFITRDIYTPEHVPTGVIPGIKMSLINKNGGLVTWSQLHCSQQGGMLLGYQIAVYKLVPTRDLVFLSTTNGTSYTLESLSPYTDYEVSVVYVNGAGSGPEPGQLEAFRTLQDVPGPPNIIAISSERTSLTVILSPPTVTNGVLLEHSISVSENETFMNSLSKSQNIDIGTNITITNLTPDTLYYVKARSSTSVGFGPFSSIVTYTTKGSTPPPPAGGSEVRESRNETCIGVTWTSPDILNGTILGYNVTFQIVGSDQQKSFFTSETSAFVCDLDAGSYYDFKVSASNSAGFSQPKVIRVSTEQPDPPVPPVPEILNTTFNTIAVALDPVVMLSSTLKYEYILFVDEVQSRSARAVSTSNTTCPGENEIPGKIVRNFSQSEIPSRTHFVIGDGKSYGPYNNTALKDNLFYDIYYVLINYFEDVCKYSYVKTKEPVKAATPIPLPTPSDDSDSNNIGLIIAIVIIILIIFIVIIVLIIICLVRRSRAQSYVPYYNEKDDYDLKVYTVLDDYDPQKWWNTIYSLRESRYIIAGREYLPEGKQLFMNSVVKVAGSGTPITFQAEFKSLPHGCQSSVNVALRRENELKNRFSHLLPYDHSRVELDPDDSSNGDYINANFIKGYKHQRAYIAAQSPFDEDTVLDFWRMIYQYEVNVIVMMSNLVEDNIVKCTQYWPNSGRVLYGQFILDLIDEQEYADYVIRTIHLRTKMDTEWQVVRIFEMTCWPEHGVPDDPIPLLDMRHKVNVYHTGYNSPIVVHCGTGVSRTGIFIGVDSLLQQYEAEGRISVVSFVRKMRKDRPAMVRTVKQYMFIYEAIFEAMVAGDTRIGHEEFKERYQILTDKNPTNGHSYLHCQFKSAQEFTRKLYPSMCSNALVPANVGKNRFCEIVPPDAYRPILITPGGTGRTDYINAVFLDSHRQKNHYLITQTPLHTTVNDFWKLVYDHDVHTIVMMEPMLYDDDTSAEYWPEDNMKQYEPFFVETTDVYQQENITIRNLKIVSMQNPGTQHMVRQFQFNAWSDSEFIPKSKSMLLDVVDLVNSWQVSASNDTTPILVHCKDGATHSGLFIAVSVLCEKVLDETEVDVYHVIKHMKRRRNQIVDMLDQYRFCYKALWDFINMRMPNGMLTSQMSRTRSDIPYKSLSLSSYTSKHEYMPY